MNRNLQPKFLSEQYRTTATTNTTYRPISNTWFLIAINGQLIVNVRPANY